MNSQEIQALTGQYIMNTYGRFPVTIDHGTGARLYDPERPMVQAELGVWEPDSGCPLVKREDMDLILVPALCYDRQGCRLGFGGGYYDRWLAGDSTPRVGLCRRAVLQERVPAEPHDSRVDVLLTEEESLSFLSSAEGGA